MTIGVTGMDAELARLAAEVREIDLLIGTTSTEIARLKEREEQAKAKWQQEKTMPSAQAVTAADEYVTALGRRMTMDAQLAGLEAKRKLIDRVQNTVTTAQRAPAPTAQQSEAAAAVNDARLLQAVIDAQEEERRRVARQVHDGPAQAMANVVLQSEISERLYDIDPKRSREELAALRHMVNKTLQELRGFIFELRPMILDDLGLVPTLRRYVQTLNEKHQIQIDLSSNGRDHRLQPDEEVAIFRLIQDSIVERIERAESKELALALDWRDSTLEIVLQSDGRELPLDPELMSGLRRSERLSLIKGQQRQERRADGRSVLVLSVPVGPAQAMIS